MNDTMTVVTSDDGTQTNRFEHGRRHNDVNQTIKLVLSSTTTTPKTSSSVSRVVVRRVKKSWYDAGSIVIGLA